MIVIHERQVLEQAIVDEMNCSVDMAVLIAESLTENGFASAADQDKVDSFLYDYFFDEMPYGTKKCRDGDPNEFATERLASMFEEELKPF